MKQRCYYQSPVGVLYIEEEQGAITGIGLAKGKIGEDEKNIHKISDETESELMTEAKRQLTEYFQRKRKTFELPLAPAGTEFQKKVWAALCTVPYGTTCSYKEIAAKIENPKGCQAVGQANGKNPILIVIPCHRVICADGTLGGYSGGIKVKKYLLRLEGKWNLSSNLEIDRRK